MTRLPWDGAIRAATDADAAAVRRLIENAGLPPDGLEDHFPLGYAVGERGGEIVGCAGVEPVPGASLLRSVVVADAWRSAGVGAALVRERLAWAQARRIDPLWLLTTSAAPWFERFGFRVVPRDDAPAGIRRSKQFSIACPDTAVLMTLDLDARGSEARSANGTA